MNDLQVDAAMEIGGRVAFAPRFSVEMTGEAADRVAESQWIDFFLLEAVDHPFGIIAQVGRNFLFDSIRGRGADRFRVGLPNVALYVD